MSDLREQLCSMISLWSLNGSEFPLELADDILALDEIREALDIRQRILKGESALGHSIG